MYLWYAYSARRKSEKAFSLLDFRSSVRLNYLDLRDDGAETLHWLGRQVEKRLRTLEANHPTWIGEVAAFGRHIRQFGVETDNVYFFMQGHTLLDNEPYKECFLYKKLKKDIELYIQQLIAEDEAGRRPADAPDDRAIR